MKINHFVLAAAALAMSACTSEVHDVHLTDALADSLWQSSQWISVADAPVVEGEIHDGSRAADGANWFASTITNDKKVASARWMTTGLGVYDLYINGERIGKEVLKPGFTHADKTKLSFTYDVTGALDRSKGADNQLSVQVTPGWWGDKIITPAGSQGMRGKRCAFRGVLELVFDDGSRQIYGTDTISWKAGIAGRVKHGAIFDGEIYDAREKEGYDCVETFGTPIVNDEFNGQIVPTNGAEVYQRHDLVLRPVESYIWSGVEGASDDNHGKVKILRQYTDGEAINLAPGETLVVDFGQNCAAVPSFVFDAAEGTTLKCEASELLNDGNGAKSRGMDGPEGSVHRLNLRIPDNGMYLLYTFAESDKPVEYLPRTTFFGYRYLSITADGDVTINSICSVPISSIAADLETGTISTGDESINKLISNTVWGQRSNYLSVPTDCPQRNERLGWMADTQVFAETGSFFADTRRFFHKWMRDVRDTQTPEGGYPGVAPDAQYGSSPSDVRLGWADAGIIVPWTVWKQFADTDIIDDNWESMAKYIDHNAAVKFDHNALVKENGNYQWADWLSYEPLESCSGIAFGPDGPLPDAVEYWSYLNACYWVIDAEMMSDMAAATGRDTEARKYDDMAKEARKYIRTRFLTDDGKFKTEILNTMQTPQLFALKVGAVDGDAKVAMIARLRENFADHGNCLQTGFLGTSILMNTLTDNGMGDLAYELLFQRKNPSWLYSIDNGATTIWERWNSYTLENGMGPKGMNSFNHYAYGCVCEWLWRTAAGISADPAAPGFKHIIMSPLPDPRLGHLDAEYKSQAGLIKSSWRYSDDGDTWQWTFTIPQGSTATVTLPGEAESKTYESGTHTITKSLAVNH